jgi:hypothetical protein
LTRLLKLVKLALRFGAFSDSPLASLEILMLESARAKMPEPEECEVDMTRASGGPAGVFGDGSVEVSEWELPGRELDEERTDSLVASMDEDL